MAKKLYYKIGEACKVLDIQPYVLRYWETEFPVLSPNKSKSGQRVYSEEDLRIIRRVKELLYEEGYTIAGAKKKLDAERASGKPLAPLEEAAAEPEKPEPAAEEPKPETAAAAEKPAPAPAAKPAKKTAKKTKKPTAAEAKAVKELEILRQGVREVLDDARELLARLDTAAGTK